MAISKKNMDAKQKKRDQPKKRDQKEGIKKKYASLRDYRIRKIIFASQYDKYSFSKKRFAVNLLNNIRNQYIVSQLNSDSAVEHPREEIELWIQGLIYNDDPKKREEGYQGEYVRIFVHRNTKENAWELNFDFILKDLKDHPEPGKNVRTGTAPNFNDPILKRFARGQVYENFDHLKSEFNALQQLYPKHIIAGNKFTLYAQIYKRKPNDDFIKRYNIEMVELENERYKATIELSEFQEGSLKKKKYIIMPRPSILKF